MHFLFQQMQYMQSEKVIADLIILKKNFKKVGSSFYLGENYRTFNPQFMEFGERFSARERFKIEAISEYSDQKFTPIIKIGNNVSFMSDIHIGCVDRIEIGDNCLFASRIYITDHDHGETTLHSLQLPPIKRRLFSKGPVLIKNNVWVGEGVAILSGVTIGENSIIATNSVVTRDVPANAVAAGIPAKIIKIITK